MMFSILEVPPGDHFVKGVDVLIDQKFGFEIRVMKSGMLNVWRTVNGRAATLQRLSKTFPSIDAAIAHYRKLQPIAIDIKSALDPAGAMERKF